MASFYGTLPEGVTDYRTHKSHIKHVVFAPDITSIGYQAFYECNNLESVTMPSGNEEHGSTEIGTQAFYGCTSLNDITFRKLSGYLFGNNIFDNIPANGTIHYPYNGDYKEELIWKYFDVFHNWSWDPYFERLIIYSTTDGKPLNLSSYEGFGANMEKDIEYTGDNGERCIVFDNNVTAIPQEAFKGKSTLSSIIIPPYVTSIGALAFHSCDSLASINIPDGVTSIGHDAFHWCSSLTSITIPGSVTSTGYAAFVECDHLDTVIISSGVTSIDDYSFLRCTSLSSVTIPSSVTTIGESAFEGCYSLASITLPAGLNSIGAMAFHSCGSLDSITIPGSVTSIGHDAFHWCGSLTSVTIPGSLTSTGYSAFNGCTGLSSVTILPGVTTIDDFSFFECTSLSSISIPSSVTYVGESAFERCSSLVSITLPSDDLTTIGDSAFYDCTNLNDITVKKAIGITLGTDVFGGTCTGVDSVKLYVPMGSESAYYNQWGSQPVNFYPYTELTISSDVKWGTCIVTFDCTLPDGVKAYKCSTINEDGNLVLTGKTTEIKANTPYILYAENGCDTTEISGKYYNATQNQYYTEGKLTGVIGQQTVTSTSTSLKFVLQNHPDEGVKFYKIEEGTNHNVRPGKCYLTISDTDEAYYRYVLLNKTIERSGLGFVFGTTEVTDIQGEQKADDTVYDLQGRPVTVMESGRIYLVNGQKILIVE